MPEWVILISNILKDSAPILGPILAVIVAYILARNAYFRQKEYEQIINRYLEQGIDLITANLDDALNIFTSNWAYCMYTLQQFGRTQKVGTILDKELYKKELPRYESKSFSTVPFYKLQSIVKDNIFWISSQILFSFIDNFNNFLSNDLLFIIKEFIETDNIQISSEELVSKYNERLLSYKKESQKHYEIIRELQHIALIIESEPRRWQDLEKLGQDPRIQKYIGRLKKEFQEEINQHRKRRAKQATLEGKLDLV